MPPARSRFKACARLSPQTTFVGDVTTIFWNWGNAEPVDCRYTGCRYSSEFATGTTIRLPRMTLLPDWFQSVTWALMIGSWSIRPSIWAGPRIEVCTGK